MPSVNLELQLKFLNELDTALAEALGRYTDEGAEKLAELEYMQREVTRARRVINDRLKVTDAEKPSRRAPQKDEAFREAAFS
ncbi:hypothetical protein [Kordiimonas aestuarii]|uniref:hypothetical protein n=1 Tax=Kordiimonas aestuarii TaxID=1005925 RepID=UPI0021D068B1|nr:hypothetical protein [Kordiimonas aestuarii]